MTSSNLRNSYRKVYCEDAINWLSTQGKLLRHSEQSQWSQVSMITSLPDWSEVPGLDLNQWQAWFMNAASLVLQTCSDEGVCIFYQTDIKAQGVWVNKAFLCQKAAEAQGHLLLWHKIVCRRPPGCTTHGRPAYAHMLCFSKSGRLTDLAHCTADVIHHPGKQLWPRGMGVRSCEIACQFVRSHTTSQVIVDPFCGRGTVLEVANQMGFAAIGVELSPKRARFSQSLKLPQDSTQLRLKNSRS